MITFEGFRKDMGWSTLEFSQEQLQAIHDAVSQEYGTFEQLDTDMGITENDTTHFSDVSLAETIGYLNDLSDVNIIETVLTAPYGYNGTSGTIYYLHEENTYCLVLFN